jgi:hypothetical protein
MTWVSDEMQRVVMWAPSWPASGTGPASRREAKSGEIWEHRRLRATPAERHDRST